MGRSATLTGNIVTRMGNEVSRTVLERTCRRNTRSRRKRKRGKESESTTTASKNNATGRKESRYSLATDAVKRAQQAHHYNTGGSTARLHGHNPAAGKTPKREAKDNSTQTGCPLGLTKTHQAVRQENAAVLLQAVRRSTPPNLPPQRGG